MSDSEDNNVSTSTDNLLSNSPKVPSLNELNGSPNVECNDLTEKDSFYDHDMSNRFENELPRYPLVVPSLREFDVLDEAKDSDEYSSDSTDYFPDCDSDLNDNEVDLLLEEKLPLELQGQRKLRSTLETKEIIRKLMNIDNKPNNDEKEGEGSLDNDKDTQVDDSDDDDSLSAERQFENNFDSGPSRSKVVLEELEYNHFDLLPEGWIKVSHRSGMPLYLHRESRVCTLTRPYFLGPGSARNHSIPLSAVPCLQYKRALENERKNRETINQQSNELDSDMCLRKARIETVSENQATQSLDPSEVHDYCKSLFQFKTINLMKHKSWVARRKQEKEKKQEEQRQRMLLPDGTKLLKFPIIEPGNESSGRPIREWIMNPNGKSYVCILHEYVQHALKKQPTYDFKEIQNPATPYSASVIINGTQYGSATGASKKLAKLEAAKVALEILIPEMKDKFNLDGNKSENTHRTGLSIFDEIKIEDPRVAEFCAKTTEPSPYAILLTCLQRNHASNEVKVGYTVNNNEHQRNVYTMAVGSHKATVMCKNKREGKQRASQAILQALHPHIASWGSLLRLYGNRSVKNVKEKKQEEQEITLLQSKASLNQPNFAILEKLRTEMRKLRDQKDALAPIGKFVPPDDIVLPTLSTTDLNKITI